jgi:hypothetical protein
MKPGLRIQLDSEHSATGTSRASSAAGEVIAGRALSGGRRERLPATSVSLHRGATVSPELVLTITILIGIVAVALIFLSRIDRGS